MRAQLTNFVSSINTYIGPFTDKMAHHQDSRWFVGYLLAETAFRFGPDKPSINALNLLKVVPIGFCVKHFYNINSLKGRIGIFVGIAALNSCYLQRIIGAYNQNERTYKDNQTKFYSTTSVDRASVVSFLQVAGTVADITAKVVNSVAAGRLFHEGAPRVVVTTTLLALSALNVWKVQGY